jgi:hypothetical protein
MGWQCPDCNIQVERGSGDTSECAVRHICLRTRAILTICQILHRSHSNKMSYNAFLDDTSLFYSCSSGVYVHLCVFACGPQRRVVSYETANFYCFHVHCGLSTTSFDRDDSS